MKGIHTVYKPKGPTSHDIINRLREETGVKKIGHAGTLDPLASGVLVVGIGREATKKLATIVKKEKEYLAVIKLGETSTTDDEEGEKKKIPISKRPNYKTIEEAVKKFVGEILQTPPVYSAVKIKGQESYKLARRGQKPVLKPRSVEVKEIRILKYQWPYLKLKVVTGPGVYIRALARDIGQELKTGGYLAELERARVGDFTLDKARAIEDLDG
jgi:tRNA pseudouridine55 synthase